MKMTSFILLRPQIRTTRLNNLREKLSSPERTDHIQGICVDLYNVFPGPQNNNNNRVDQETKLEKTLGFGWKLATTREY